MKTTELIRTSGRLRRSPAGKHLVRATDQCRHGGRDLPLVESVPFGGPPIILLASPLVLFALALTGPFVLLVTVALLIIAAVGLVALTGAILASPYLLVRGLRTRRSFAAPAPASAPTAQCIPAGSRQDAV